VNRPLIAPASAPAKVGVVIGLVGLVLAVFFWAGVVGGGAESVDTSSPSYID
jgi:hypothetical protein